MRKRKRYSGNLTQQYLEVWFIDFVIRLIQSIDSCIIRTNYFRYCQSFYLLIIILLTIPIGPFSDLAKVYAQEQVIETISVGSNPFNLEYNLDNGNMYVTNLYSNTVSVIDQNNEVVDNIPVGRLLFGLAYHPGNSNMYVTNQTSNTVSEIDEPSITHNPLAKSILDSGNNINMQVQKNSGNNTGQ